MIRLINGNSIEIIPKLKPKSIDLVFTSPPYNMGKEYEDDMTEDEYLDWMKLWMSEIPRLLNDGGVFVLNIGDKVTKVERSLRIPKLWLYASEELGLHYIENYIWNKMKFLPIKSKYRATNAFEYCLWFSKDFDFRFNYDDVRRPYSEASLKRMKKPYKKRWSRKRDANVTEYKAWKPNPKGALPKNILDIGSESNNKIHTAVFPEKLAEFFILSATNEGDTVLDPFSGSGTTAKVCKDNNRNCIGIELNSEYVKIAKERCEL